MSDDLPCSPAKSLLADQGIEATQHISEGPSSASPYRFQTTTTLVSPTRTAPSETIVISDDSVATPTLQNQPLFSLRANPSATLSKTIDNMYENRRKWVWLSPSTWSFTIRIMLTLGEKLRPSDPLPPRNLLHSNVYSLQWRTSLTTKVDVSGLPSLSHALFLLNAASFHLGETYQLFDDQELGNQIRSFYANSTNNVDEHRLWFIKFLLILAFGAAFQAAPNDNKEPPGYKFFSRAMALMPDLGHMWKESLLGVEILAMAGLYLFSVDERESAHLYLVNAIRIAQMEGLHTQLPEKELGTETVAYCRDLWWTLYIMDRHFSSSVGVPMAVHDDDITTPVVSSEPDSVAQNVRSLQVNLSHLLSMILRTVYKPTKTPMGMFLEQTKSIIQTLAHHARDIERIVRHNFENSPGAVPRELHYLTMLYHQCVIVTTRPPLFSVLKQRLETLGHPDHEQCDIFLCQTKTIISTGIKSAAKTLQTLAKEYSMLEVFLPYDVEFTFGSALQLTVASAVFPNVVDYKWFRQSAQTTLNKLVDRGSRLAATRAAELQFLEELCDELALQGRRQGHRNLTLSRSSMISPDPATLSNGVDDNMIEHGYNSIVSDNDLHASDIDLPGSTDQDSLDSIGISAEDFFSIMQLIPNVDMSTESFLNLEL
ncbi:hypothetical protein QQS21_000359 [Conoideocrella luteorostrata]|uniref:Xylanolytic transcriptional activator regulatory domain-containing protein n=1 Tax=Conoideocrella luteorostrata TaxID=1105319 RepID=A0AAJ0G2M6_9HYPO|nr:hypothetical protein QQS21_000359 [Conoideocrella luteorostrata]